MLNDARHCNLGDVDQVTSDHLKSSDAVKTEGHGGAVEVVAWREVGQSGGGPASKSGTWEE